MAVANSTESAVAAGVGEAFLAWRHLAHTVRLRERIAQRESGLSGAQLFALRQLSLAPEISLGELARRTATHASSISVVVSRLIEKGLVERHRDPADKRRVSLCCTEAGTRRLERSPASADALLMQALERLPESDRASLAQSLETLAQAVSDPNGG